MADFAMYVSVVLLSILLTALGIIITMVVVLKDKYGMAPIVIIHVPGKKPMPLGRYLTLSTYEIEVEGQGVIKKPVIETTNAHIVMSFSTDEMSVETIMDRSNSIVILNGYVYSARDWMDLAFPPKVYDTGDLLLVKKNIRDDDKPTIWFVPLARTREEIEKFYSGAEQIPLYTSIISSLYMQLFNTILAYRQTILSLVEKIQEINLSSQKAMFTMFIDKMRKREKMEEIVRETIMLATDSSEEETQQYIAKIINEKKDYTDIGTIVELRRALDRLIDTTLERTGKVVIDKEELGDMVKVLEGTIAKHMKEKKEQSPEPEQ